MRWFGQIRENKMGLSLFNPQSAEAFTHIETLKMARLSNLQSSTGLHMSCVTFGDVFYERGGRGE